MVSFRKILTPDINKLLLFFILILFVPAVTNLSESFLEQIGDLISNAVILPEYFYEDILAFTFLILEFIVVFFLSFFIGELISNKYKPNGAITIKKALVWAFGTTSISYFIAGYMGAENLYGRGVLIPLSKYIIIVFILAFGIEFLKLKSKNSLLNFFLTIILIIFLLIIVFFEMHAFMMKTALL